MRAIWASLGLIFVAGLAWIGPSVAPDPPVALNAVEEGKTLSDAPSEALPGKLRRVSNRLVAEFVHEKKVDYDGLRKSELFADYLDLTRQLNVFDLETLDTLEKQFAFWINLYNALVMHSVLESGVEGSVREKERFFDRYAYRIGEHLFTPNDIEHGILRGVAMDHRDPRFRHVLPRLDPRIHFALNCASAGCPPIAAYDAERIEEQLSLAARSFVNSPSEVSLDREKNVLRLSKIFEWYHDDFGFEDDSVLRFIEAAHRDLETRKYLATHRDTLRVEFNEYDWSLNH